MYEENEKEQQKDEGWRKPKPEKREEREKK